MGLRKGDTKGVFCLDGDWERDLASPASVEPVLRLLQDVQGIPYIHRNVGTRAELEHYVRMWAQKRYQGYPILHLAFHGEPGLIRLSYSTRRRDALDIDTLESILQGHCAGRIVHLGSCATLALHATRLARFLHASEAVGVCGYRHYVDWVTSAAFELTLFYKMQERAFSPWGVRLIDRDVRRLVPGLCRHVGFVMKAQA